MSLRHACVIGWPIGHSRSPLIHHYWLRQYGIAGDYGRLAIPPEDLRGFLLSLADRGFAGCNVTVPHKEAAFAAVEIADAATRRLKVVNTVFLRHGKTYGTSTDGEGFLANLRQCTGGWSSAGKRIVILGAGGAARAIAGALIDDGAGELVVVNRNVKRAEMLRWDFGATVTPATWSAIAPALAVADLIVNTTSLGMTGQPPLDLALDALPLTATVADIVYSPLETPLLRQAKARGLTTVPGLGMLLHQAVRGFELWFGVRPEVTPELAALVAADLEGRG